MPLATLDEIRSGKRMRGRFILDSVEWLSLMYA
jgi:hypothetical protein